MVMERAQQHLDSTAMELASSVWGPHEVGGAQSGTERR